MEKRVMLIGGAGFVGSHVADVLRDAGREVYVVDDLSTCRLDEPDGDAPMHPTWLDPERRATSVGDALIAFGGKWEAVVNLGCRWPLERERAVVEAAWRSYVVDFAEVVSRMGRNGLCRRFVVGSTLDVYRYEGRRTAFGALVGAARQYLRYWHRPPLLEVYFAHLPEVYGVRKDPDAFDFEAPIEERAPFGYASRVEDVAKALVDRVILGPRRKDPDVAMLGRRFASTERCPARPTVALPGYGYEHGEGMLTLVNGGPR